MSLRLPLACLPLSWVWAGVAACGRDEGSSGAKDEAAPAPAAGPPAAGTAAAGASPAPPSAAALAPWLSPVGPEGGGPEWFAVHVALDAVGAGTVLEFDPPVAGKLTPTSSSTFRFDPERGFRPGARHTARLLSVGVEGGVVRAPADGADAAPWSAGFETPAFGLQRVTGLTADDKARTAEVGLLFTAAVDPDAVAGHARVTVGRRPGRIAGVKPGGRHGEVRLLLEDVAVPVGAEVAVSVRAGLPWKGDAAVRAPAAERSALYGATAAVTIRAVSRREGPGGHFLEVICDDAAAAGKEDVWDRETYDWYSVSGRCLPTEASARDHVATVPPLPIEVAASRGGFRILGDFRRGPYTVRLTAGLQTVDGGVLSEGFDRSVTIPPRSKAVHLPGQGRYLPKKAWRSLAVRHVNTPELVVTVRHIPRRNFVFWLAGPSETADERVADVVAETRRPAKAPPDAEVTTFLDLDALVPAPQPGVYEIAVGHGGSDGAAARARLLLTDMNLIAKVSRPAPGADWTDEVRVWASGIEAGEPRPDVEVTLITASGRTVGACRTDLAGGCAIEVPPKGTDPSPPVALIASSGPDFTYLKLDELKIDLADSSVEGEPYREATPYHAGLYADRDLYRPGETAHVVAVVRDGADVAPAAGLPVELHVVDSRARVARRLQGATDPTGLVALDVRLPSGGPTGRWSAKLLVGKAEVGRLRLSVEEFVPERMAVTATAVQADLLAGDPLGVRIGARYLFGGSAEGSPVEVTCQVLPHDLALPARPDLRFGPALVHADGLAPAPRPVDLGTVAAELDAQGRATVTCPGLPSPGAFVRPGKVVANVAVMEAGGGRATHQRAEALLHPARIYLGLRADRGGVSGAVVDWEGAAVKGAGAPAAIDVEVEQLTAEYGWWWDASRTEESWKRQLRRASRKASRVPVKDGVFRIDAAPGPGAAGALVRASAQGAMTELYLPGEAPAYAWDNPWGGTDRTPRPGRPAPLPLATPEEVSVGAQATVTVRAPYKGRALFSLETHEVLAAEWKDVVAGENTWTFTVPSFTPNVYVSALVLKDPHLESPEAFVPERAFAVRSVRVRPDGFVQAVRVSAPAEVRPHAPLPVEVAVEGAGPDGPVAVTVAAVDEGILSLTGYAGPDPVGALFARRALGVDTHETVGWALKGRTAGPAGATGGDGEAADSGPPKPMPIKPVALWSGVVQAKDGRARVELDVPGWRGRLKVMAVAVSRRRVGAGQALVTVKDPLTLQATLPRHLAGDDEVEIPVFVTNTTDRDRDVALTVSVHELPAPGLLPPAEPGPPVEVLGPDAQTVRLARGASATAVFRVRALRQSGAATFRVAARSDDLRSYDEADVPLLPAGPRVSRVTVVELAEGANDLAPHLRGWAPGGESTTLWATALEDPAAFGRLSYLLRYPHGCIEQTTSTTRPLLYLSDLLSAAAPGAIEAGGGVDAMVRAGLDRVLSMQTPSGGFAYWPGDGEPVAWATAYATHLLLDARQRRYPVPGDRLDEALAWLDGRAGGDGPAAGDGAGGDDGLGTQAYAHYVLAKAGRPHKARISQLLAEAEAGGPLDGPAAEARYLLLAANRLAGDRSRDADLRRFGPEPPPTERWTGHGYYSDLRRRGMTLATFVDLFPGDPAGEGLARQVAKGLRDDGEGSDGGSWTTQELAWGVTGLGKWAEGRPTAAAAGLTLVAAGRDLPGDRWALDRASEHRGLLVRAKGLPQGGLRLVVRSEGVPAAGQAPAGGAGLRVERQRLDPSGAGRGGAPWRLGRVVHTRLTITNTSGRRLENVVLTDRLPAGFEVENPRLGRGGDASWVNPDVQWVRDHMEIRDDRIEVFGALEPDAAVEVVYSARTVAAGRFAEPPVEAEAMYDPAVWAREPGGRVEVRGPWDAEVD